MSIRSETELYQPVKNFLTSMGYEVRGEVNHCDLVAVKEGEEPVIVELKKTFNLPLLVQGMERLKLSPQVYLAVEMPASGKAPYQLKWREIRDLCRRLGLGLITVRFYKTRRPAVEVMCRPEAGAQAVRKKQAARLMTEFHERSGDYNVGGSSKRKIVTAYREKALVCANMLKRHGPLSPRQLRDLTGIPQVGAMLRDNYYLWFTKIARGLYRLNEQGEQALLEYSTVTNAFHPEAADRQPEKPADAEPMR